MNNMGKTVSVFLKQEELERLEVLKRKGIKTIEIFRRGIEELEKSIDK